jgi:hypothetical protein
MAKKIYAIAAMATLLISAPAWVAQASPDGAVASHYHHHRWHYRDADYRYYRSTLPYDGYRPYPPPIYQCPYFGAPVPLYPYCWWW